MTDNLKRNTKMRKKVLIDLDDVICNNAFLALVNKMAKTNFTYDDAKEYMLDTLIIDKDIRQDFYRQAATSNIYRDAVFLPDAYKVLQELNKHFSIYVCTACVMPTYRELCGVYYKDKYNYLFKELPFLDPEKFIFTNSKDLFNADYQIDDKLENLKGTGIKNKILFDSYHNRDIDEKVLKKHKVRRVKSWQEIAKILLGYEVK